nr:MAG TPA: hypothetical protein [Caudoviricetes sp.]
MPRPSSLQCITQLTARKGAARPESQLTQLARMQLTRSRSSQTQLTRMFNAERGEAPGRSMPRRGAMRGEQC